ncbi:MAG: lipoprotein-releasing system permease protein, partial [Pirellulaceae bacterium]
MYKLLLSWRYLRTRYIALASIISVTLGVATLIIVNAVMAGFSIEMHKRLNDMMSDIMFQATGLNGFPDPEAHIAEIKRVLGDDLEGATATVTVPAMLSFQFRGQWVPTHVTLIGIDEETYASVSDFRKFLLNEQNRKKLNFNLHESGYDSRLGQAGWPYRRIQESAQQTYDEERQRIENIQRQKEREQQTGPAETGPAELGASDIPVDNVAAGIPLDSGVGGPTDPSMADPSLSNPTGETAT